MDLVKCPECSVFTPVSDMHCVGCGLPMCILLNIVNSGPESQKVESFKSITDDEYAALQNQKKDNPNNEKSGAQKAHKRGTDFDTEEKTEEEKAIERAKKRIYSARHTPIQITVEEMAKYTELGIVRWYFMPAFSFYYVQQNRFKMVFFSYIINSAYVLDGTIKDNVMSVFERLYVIKKERKITTRYVLRNAIEKRNQDYLLKKLMVQVASEKERTVLDIFEFWDILNDTAKHYDDRYSGKRDEISRLAASLGLKSYSSIAVPVGTTLSRGGKLRK